MRPVIAVNVGLRKRELANVDRNQSVVAFGFGNGVFELLAALMGFEEALIAIFEEPEEVYALFEAITDYKLKALDYLLHGW